MRLEPIIDRLQGLGFVTLGGVLEFAGLKDRPPAGRLPAAYAVPGDSSAQRTERVGITDQKLTHEFSVVLILDANARAGAARISEQLETLSRAVIMQLLGWTHPDMAGACQFASTRLVSASAGAVIWAISFTSTSHLRKA